MDERTRNPPPEEQELKDAYKQAMANLKEVRKYHSKHSKPVARAKGEVRKTRKALLDYRRAHGMPEFAFRGQRESREKHQGVGGK